MRVLAALMLLALGGCAFTAENRLWDIHESLHSPEMERAIQQARQ